MVARHQDALESTGLICDKLSKRLQSAITTSGFVVEELALRAEIDGSRLQLIAEGRADNITLRELAGILVALGVTTDNLG